MRHRLIDLALALAALAAPAGAQVRLVEAGIVCPREPTGAFEDAPGTEAGAIRRIEEAVVFDLPDRNVPTITNLSFGLRAALDPGAEATDVTIVVEHPPMGERDVTRQEWDDTILPGGGSISLFTFEEAYEKVPGPWRFSIEAGGATLVEVAFEVTAEDGRGAVERACFQFLS